MNILRCIGTLNIKMIKTVRGTQGENNLLAQNNNYKQVPNVLLQMYVYPSSLELTGKRSSSYKQLITSGIAAIESLRMSFACVIQRAISS